jgi:hypothetical protein
MSKLSGSQSNLTFLKSKFGSCLGLKESASSDPTATNARPTSPTTSSSSTTKAVKAKDEKKAKSKKAEKPSKKDKKSQNLLKSEIGKQQKNYIIH